MPKNKGSQQWVERRGRMTTNHHPLKPSSTSEPLVTVSGTRVENYPCSRMKSGRGTIALHGKTSKH